MKRICKATGCGLETSTPFSPLCRSHRARLRRHGDIEQKGITKADLLPFIERVDKRREKNPESPLWEHLEARWATIVRHAKAVVADFNSGRALNKYEVEAAREALAISRDATAREVVDAALGMYLMQGLEPLRFRSDEAFWTQLVRRVRGIASRSSGKTINAKGTVRPLYREMPPRTSLVLQGWLKEAFGAAGLRLVQLEEQEAEAEREERREYRKALAALK
ncbi:hypothetical protein EJC49_01075 [Aquibium carbonis]|uniref:Uncharacterized protein n=1 Tax=Aquibium carbonis TaxID=2495581 RepID=A0A3R9YI86_9HYPH|nr:hypothetical protein [Aquibium carbonis]RST88321.1 hypothetical protein EJC49_01075 [Aquibium carbonis]